jgi:hypothetical protein
MPPPLPFIPPIESMRVGGLPASSRPRTASESVRDLIDSSDRADASVAYPALRTCACGSQVLRGSPADAAHRAECGEPEEAEEARYGIPHRPPPEGQR